MIARKLLNKLKEALRLSPAVALLGPRQVGKTTLAKLVSKGRSSVYLDLEDISPSKAIIVCPGEGSYPKQDGIIVAGLKESIKMLS